MQVEISLVPTVDALYNQANDQSVRCTPYSIAILNGHQDIVTMLIDAGVYALFLSWLCLIWFITVLLCCIDHFTL